MPAKQIVRLEFPSGGRSDRFAYQSQPAKTTVSARNVWPDAQRRERGGSRPGFTKAFAETLGQTITGLGTINYVPNASNRIISQLVVIGGTNGELWADNGLGSTALSHVATDVGLASGELLSMAERNQKLYIAGHSINQATSESLARLDVYDPEAGTLTAVVATDGLIPRGCPCICTWRDRLVLAGGTTTPYGVFMSRQGEPTDWDFSEEDAGAAVDLGVASAGQIGETVTSLTPHADNCLIIGCPSSLWILMGDPRSGGQLANLSRSIGVVDRNAWCTTPDGLFVFLSADGIYTIPAGCSMEGNPVSLSRERLPAELLNINTQSSATGKAISLAYDVRWRGIHVFVTSRNLLNSDAGNVHWFFDWETKSFWEVQYDLARFNPWSCHARPNYPSSESTVMMGCQDGYVRKYLSTATKDDEGEATQKKITSYVTLGPFADEPAMQSDIRLDELDVTMSAETTDVTWSVYRGNSAEEAVTSLTAGEEAAAGRVKAGRNPRFFPRVKGSAIFLRFYSQAVWAFEAATAVLAKLGRTRV